MSAYTLKTALLFTLSDNNDSDDPHEVKLVIRFNVYRGCEPTLEQPGEGPSASIQDVTIIHEGRSYPAPEWLWPFLESDEGLQGELLHDAVCTDEYHRDQAADAKREERRHRP
jgi:hypothetical protein